LEKKSDTMDKFLLSYLEKKYGVGKTTPIYGAAELLLRRLWQGSVCVSTEDLKREISNFTESCLMDSEAVVNNNGVRPLVLDDGNLYIQRYFVYQTKILEKIGALLDNKKIHIITGGPGTGKTTSLAKILGERLDEKILLAAPTGKAALRMRESLADQGITLEAKTLHRLLGYIPQSVNFKHTKEKPIEADIIAVDECSMIDLPMMSKLLDAVPNNCDLYLLGDRNQLASIEAGSVFADICRMFEKKFKDDESVYNERKINYRAKSAPGINRLSKQILENSEVNPVTDFDNENVRYFESDRLERELFGRYRNLFDAKNHEDALKFLKTFQILCATKTGPNGTARINARLYALAKKENSKFTPIIITENNYQLNLFNGDVGVEDGEQAYFYTGNNEIKPYSVLTLPENEPAFAITIHKSQGSEYDSVSVVYPDREMKSDDSQAFLTKELLYTAITRAKNECLIFGGKDILINSCKREIFRASGIK